MLVVTRIGRCLAVHACSGLFVLTRVRRCGRTFSKMGRRCGQQATMIPALICAIAHIKQVPMFQVTSLPWYWIRDRARIRRAPMMMVLAGCQQ